MKRLADLVLCLISGGGAGWSLATGRLWIALVYVVFAIFFYNQLWRTDE